MLSVVLVESANPNERSLTCFGALEVIMNGDQPEFRTYHLTAAGMGGPDALCERLAQLSADRHIILGQPAIYGDFWDWQEILSSGEFFVSSIRAFDDLQPSGMSVLSLSGSTLTEIGRRMKLPLTPQSKSLEAARLAPERAELLWLGFIQSRTRTKTRESLFAAYQAWCAIERARPLPF
ncbi:MAG: hypothetical protein P1U62_15120 [Alteraurantiacibacter sp. bin_em_oilr2.035]|nr:hypothetical protein [Alteraurantiacibacter sp. bin_em_oilr2.035]